MLRTPTKPFQRKASSVCSQPNPGSVRSILSSSHWRTRGDDEIPSDESDTGDKNSYGSNVRTRVRKRRAISVRPGAMKSWMQTKSMRMEVGNSAVPVPGYSSIIAEKNVKKALFTTSKNSGHQSTTKSNLGESAGLQLHGSNPPNMQERRRTISPKFSPVAKETRRSISNRIPDSGTLNSYASVDWVLYSVWHPAWDVIWKCDNGKLPLAQNQYFRKLIMEVLAANITAPNLNEFNDLKVIRVKDLLEDNLGKLSIVGTLEPGGPKRRKDINWKPNLPTLERLFNIIVSNSDLIVQCKCDQAENLRRKISFIHITSKDGQQVNVYKMLEIAQVITYDINYDYYKPKVVKCFPLGMLSKYVVDENRLEASSAVVTVPTAANRLPLVQLSTTMEPQKSQTGGNVLLSTSTSQVGSFSLPNPPVIVDDGRRPPTVTGKTAIIVPPSSLEKEIEEIEISDDDDCEYTTSGHPRTNNAENFNLQNFLSGGQFVPGPLRPKVKKADKNAYEYNTLENLAEMLHDSITEDVALNVVPNMIVKRQCHAYGVVVEIINQFRHENAYYVRISDETMESVLLRIHKATSDKIVGPQIELGSIIRIHRLTVQMEWDSWISENTMVLSTASHNNYVLFEPSDEPYQFYYNTCARSLTLEEFDKMRVGELYIFKSNLVIPQNKIPNPVSHNSINIDDAHHEPPPGDMTTKRDTVNSAPLVSPADSEGICTSDLVSPSPTIDEPRSKSNSESYFEDSPVQPVPLSNSRSDESFFSATSEVDAATVDDCVELPRQSLEVINVDHGSAQLTSNSQNFNFTLFKDLRMTKEALSLLCQIVSLSEHVEEDAWYLILQDLELTVPSDGFKQDQNPQGHKEWLTLSITNGQGLEDRDLLRMLFDSQGSDEFFCIENVKVKGVCPPYQLEIDGSTCGIRRHNDIMTLFNMDGTFDQMSGELPKLAQSNTLDAVSEEIVANPPDANEQQLVDHEVCVDEMDDENIDDLGLHGSSMEEDEVAPLIDKRGKSPQSAYVTAGHTPSHSPSKVNKQLGGTHVASTTSNEDSWTGRLRGKRKPRRHYQAEDSFEC